MDNKTLAVQIMALKTKAEMATKQGNLALRDELLSQMRELADQSMLSPDMASYVLVSTVYSILIQIIKSIPISSIDFF